MITWHPISTVPRDQDVLLAKYIKGKRPVWIASGYIGADGEPSWCQFTDDKFDAEAGDYHQPTHWAHLPAPPYFDALESQTP